MHTGSPASPGSPPSRRPPTVLVLVAAVLALLLGGAAPALAHTALSGSDPADGSVLQTPPRQVTLTFTESISFPDEALRVLSPANERVNPRPAQHADGKANTARVELSGELPEGTYTVAWRVISADGHPISGAFTFSIGTPSETAATVTTDSPDDTAVGRLYGFFRYLAYSGLALLVGAAAFILLCWPAAVALRPVRRLLVAGWAALAVATVALLLLRGPYEAAGSLASAFDPARLARTATGKPGTAFLVRLALLLAAAAVMRLHPAVRPFREGDGSRPPDFGVRFRLAATALALGLALTWATAEHASAGLQVPLAMPVAALHLVAMGVWLGGLITLVIALRDRGPGGLALPASAVGRFATLAFRAVAVLVGTGLYQSWRQVGSWEALTGTSYGRTLVAKGAAVVLVLYVASYSRRAAARLLEEPVPADEAQRTPEPEAVRVAQLVGASGSREATGGSGGPDTAAEGRTDGAGGHGDGDRGGDGDGGDGGGDGGGDSAGPSPAAESERYRRGLRRTVAAEAVLGVVVLAITTLLTGTQPSRAAVSESASVAVGQEPQAKVVTVPFDMGAANRRGQVQITLAPGRVGENTVEAVVFSEDGGLATVPELRLTLTQRESGIGPLDAKLKNQKGYWATYDLRLPMAGEWSLDIVVRTTEIDQVTVHGTVRIT
ncbi:copper resistance CopC/CopD family protein [Streptomyces yangpuensis]|uniref:copper resistance CopC/CopD family protein n=1 Tax=Streptomyces yangpuensis TaxID=1648182 RepID=UPI0035D90352